MGSRKGAVDFLQPVRGLVTEASDVAFPQDAAYDLDNVEITPDGKTRKRLAFERENVISGETTLLEDFTEADRAASVYSTFLWRLTAGAEQLDLRIIQNRNKVIVIPDESPLSQQPVLLSYDMTVGDFGTGNAITTTNQYAYGAGFVLITNENANTVVMRVTSETLNPLSLTVEPIEQMVRTRHLIEPYDDGDDYGLVLGFAEEWNLRNSGWPFSAYVSSTSGGDGIRTDRDTVAWYFEKRGVYPHHSRIYNAMKTEVAAAPSALGTFNAWADERQNFGNTTVPPLGRFIHSAFEFNALEVMEANGDTAIRQPSLSAPASNVPQYSIKHRPMSCAFLNGHAIYGSIDENNNTRILVSQQARTFESLARCYQEADPTAEEINDLIATDGFTLSPSGMGKPLAMRETSQGVVILCTNGVWLLRGTGGPFSALDSELAKLGAVEFNSPNSVVVVDDIVFFCADKGIYSVAPNQFGEMALTNLTETTIKTLYLDYGRDVISKIQGTYVQSDNYIYWLIPNEPVAGSYGGDAQRILVLNITLGGFFTYSLKGGGDRPTLHLPMTLTNTKTEAVQEPLTLVDGSTGITLVDGTPITSEVTALVKTKDTLGFFSSYRFFGVLRNMACTVSSPTMVDWQELGSVYEDTYSAYIEFAFIPPNSLIGGVQAPYIHSFFEQGRQTAQDKCYYNADVVEEAVVPTIEQFRINQVYAMVVEVLNGN